MPAPTALPQLNRTDTRMQAARLAARSPAPCPRRYAVKVLHHMARVHGFRFRYPKPTVSLSHHQNKRNASGKRCSCVPRKSGKRAAKILDHHPMRRLPSTMRRQLTRLAGQNSYTRFPPDRLELEPTTIHAIPEFMTGRRTRSRTAAAAHGLQTRPGSAQQAQYRRWFRTSRRPDILLPCTNAATNLIRSPPRRGSGFSMRRRAQAGHPPHPLSNTVNALGATIRVRSRSAIALFRGAESHRAESALVPAALRASCPEAAETHVTPHLPQG
ncbi:hypothetical protein KC325_g43 [Hortaea werneckii]|nr:hypothetical protein KC325_g43 [Hortaea werneckii]